MTQPLVALDIGATKVTCAIGLPHEHSAGFELLGSSVVAYPSLADTWLHDPLLVSRTIEQALEATAVTADLQRALVAINPPTAASEHTPASISLADEPIAVRGHDVSRLQALALDHALAVDREPLLIEPLGFSGNGFHEVRDPRGLPATRLRGVFHILTTPLAVRRAVVQAVEGAGLEVVRVSHGLPALWACDAGGEHARKRVLILDVGGLTTSLGVFADGVLQAAAVAPWGGLRLAASIAHALGSTLDQAAAAGLEGAVSKKPEVRRALEEGWAALQPPLGAMLQDGLRPDTALLAGRGALIDGFAERVEQATGLSTSLCRSPRTSRISDLARQISLSPVLGLLELATRNGPVRMVRTDRFFNRLIDRTRLILTEYF